ncbi:MAG: hypothetical protein AAF800_08625 [Planctomycetota bacterium]
MLHQPQDRDLTFYFQVYRDPREARWCLTQLRRVYPGATVMLVSDGDDRSPWKRLAERFNAHCHIGQRLYGTEHGGRMLQRMLDLFADRPTPYLIKIDTDTWAHRRLGYLPTGRKVFGTLEWYTFGRREPLGFPNVQGGFVGYTREAATLIRSSKVLLSPRLRDYANTYADVEEIRGRAERGMVSSDFLTRYACRSLGIECEEFGEVKSKYRGWVAETDGQFAFTHPHKEIAGRSPLAAVVRDALPRAVKAPARSAVRVAKTSARSLLGRPTPRPRPSLPVSAAPPTVAASDAA